MTNQLRVFLIDDDPDVLKTMSRALGKRGYSVDSYASATDFLEAYSSNFEGCIILDLSMPKMNGLELQQALSEKNTLLPIIFITGHGGVTDSVKALKAGASDFLEKPFRQTQLIEAIENAFNVYSQRKTVQEDQSIFEQKYLKLTQRERELLKLILEAKGELSSKALARELNISHRTVDQHRARIFFKMEVSTMTELVGDVVKYFTQHGSLPLG